MNCRACGKPATRNYQKIWVMYKVYKNGGYSRSYQHKGMYIEEPTGEDNLHFCDACGEEFEAGNEKIYAKLGW